MKKLAITLFFLCSLAGTNVSAAVIIWEIYGGGNNSSATFQNDYIYLYNNGSSPVDLSTWSIQTSAATSMSPTVWNVVNLTGTIPANGWYLVKFAGGTTNGAVLPSTPNQTSATNLNATAGKIGLYDNQTARIGDDAANVTSAQDFVGYGSTANQFESAYAPAPSNSTSIKRTGFTDSNNNSTDFAVVSPNTALPIELTTFQARAENEAVQLSWTTASESNNDRFEVQERVGDTWNKVSEVKGNGTSTVSNNYAVAMQNLEAGYHTFRLKQVDYDGKTSYSDEVRVLIELQDRFQLSEAYPNPFNPSTAFSLTVAKDQQVQVQVYDMTGRLVATLFNGQMKANEINRFSFDAQNLASGVYFYRTVGENFTMTKKMLLMK
jgi:archaellin